MLFYFLSLIFLLVVFLIKKIRFIDIIHWIFLSFMILYNFFPMLIFRIFPVLNTVKFQFAQSNEGIFETQLFISSCIIITYSLLLLFSRKNYRLCYKENKIPEIKLNLILVYFILFPIGLYLSNHNNWTTGDRTGIGASLTAYVRNTLEVLGIMIFIKYRKNEKYRVIILISFVLLSVIDTQRTSLFVLFLAYIITLKDIGRAKNTFIILIIAVASIGILRNGVSLLNVLYPFIGEGVFGSYGFLQVIYTVNNAKNLNLWFISLNEIIIKGFSYLSVNLNIPTLSGYMMNEYYSGHLNESYFPMAGYFFPAGAHLAMPYFGPLIQISLFYFIIRKITSLRSDVYLKVILYSNLFLLFKATFAIALNFVIFQIIVYYFIRISNKIYVMFIKGVVKNKNIN